MRVLVTGATGFTGSFVVPHLCESGYEVTCLVRPCSNKKLLEDWPVEFIQGDLDSPETLALALRGKDALVNVASIGFGHAAGIVRACQEAGIHRTIFFSTTAIFTTLPAKSKAIRLEAERAIKESSLHYTILRPTMIYGSNRDRNMSKLIKFVDKYPIVPVFGDGESLQQPVFVQDLANAVVQALNTEKTVRKTYNLSGLLPITYNEVIDTIVRQLKKRILKVHLPVKLSSDIVQLASRVPGLPKFSPEQILRLNENKAFSHQEANADFGYQPLSFEEGIAKEIAEYRSNRGSR